MKVPVGTQIYDEAEVELIADLSSEGQRFVIATGGKGGVGNAHYKSSTNRAPINFTLGTEEEEFCIKLQLKLLSDVGIIGMPNAGKSSLLARCTMAKTKIADYPFTTLEPHLGVAQVNGYEMVLADIPGLIENASEGVGLGHRFLKHIERCSVLLHMIDATAPDIVETYKLVRRELEMYSKALTEKPELIVLNKCDLITELQANEKKAELELFCNKQVFILSLLQNTSSLLSLLVMLVGRMYYYIS